MLDHSRHHGESATKTVKFFVAHTVNWVICNNHTIIDWMLLNFTPVIQQNCHHPGRKFEKSFCTVDRLSCQLELSKSVIWDTNVIDVNVIFTRLKVWLFCFDDVQTDPNTMYKRIMACRWPAPSHYLNQRWYILSIGPLQTNFSENLIEIHIFAFKKMHLKISSGKMASFLSGPQWVNMNQVFMLVYSRSVTMPGLHQNWSLLPALGRFRRKVVLSNYGVKKIQGNMSKRCRSWCRPPRSAQHGFDVSHNTWIL